MVVDKHLLALCFFILIQGCNRFENSNFSFSGERNQELIDPDYLHTKPIAQIINLPIMSEADISFVLKKDTWVKIYAVGEADISRTSALPRYQYKGDEVEYYFDISKGEILNKPISVPLLRTGVYIGDTLHYKSGEKKFSLYYDINLRKYEIKASIPWKSLNISPEPGMEIGFNTTLGDNDDKLKQKARLAWVGTKDILYEKHKVYGKILLLSSQQKNIAQDVLPSILNGKSSKNNFSEMLPKVAVSNLVFGQVNKAEDFSATIRSSWDTENLYIFTEVLDNASRFVDFAEVKKLSEFYDSGTIEDSLGKTVWKMQNFYTKHAGGAKKNQIADTIITLKAGKYLLKYSTDESHSWNNWDDKPPQTPFYGIVIYNAQDN